MVTGYKKPAKQEYSVMLFLSLPKEKKNISSSSSNQEYFSIGNRENLIVKSAKAIRNN